MKIHHQPRRMKTYFHKLRDGNRSRRLRSAGTFVCGAPIPQDPKQQFWTTSWAVFLTAVSLPGIPVLPGRCPGCCKVYSHVIASEEQRLGWRATRMMFGPPTIYRTPRDPSTI